jgi:hypothetical protein
MSTAIVLLSVLGLALPVNFLPGLDLKLQSYSTNQPALIDGSTNIPTFMLNNCLNIKQLRQYCGKI